MKSSRTSFALYLALGASFRIPDDETNEKRTWVRITHPFHPWRRRFRFVASKRTWGEERITFVNRQGKARSVPVNWIDVALSQSYAMLGNGRVRVPI
jgi:Family of unknown function (DUF5372)